MRIEYKGHSCFTVTDSETGYSVIFDPYSDGSVPGLGVLHEEADLILCSHEHHDHAGAKDVKERGTGADNPFDIRVIDTFHDPEKGALRGRNRIHVLTLRRTGEKLIHYGDIGEQLYDLLNRENFHLLHGAEYSLVPIGGTYTYDAAEALELIECTAPGLAIVMHYRSDEYGFGFGNIGTVDDFMKMAEETGALVHQGRFTTYDTKKDNLLYNIISMQPEYAQNTKGV